jgi:tRNA modification GTPase
LIPAADTITAIATPAGRGGIGVVRISGPRCAAIAQAIIGRVPAPRMATRADFRGEGGTLIDQGLALFFPAPHSYTGEDVLELQGHGGPVVMRELLRACTAQGARLAQPGEFTRRAFLGGRIDLAQAESVADLIDASSAEAARSAVRSLAGDFSRRVHALVRGLVELRMHVEACIDFPEEEIDLRDRESMRGQLAALLKAHQELCAQAKQGAVLRDGLNVVLVGPPNVGKSSLLNCLAGEEVAIVTPIPGTTRDLVRATVILEGVPVHLVDTAGLRDASDEVERIGIERAWNAIASAGAAIVLGDGSAGEEEEARIRARLPAQLPVAHVRNKIDLAAVPAAREDRGGNTVIRLSARTGEGVGHLRSWLLATAGWRPHGESLFLARERHLVALDAAGHALLRAEAHSQAFELFAEELKIAQQALGSITGEVSADELLGEIFGRFCIGK